MYTSNLGTIQINNNYGVAPVFQADVVSLNGLIANDKELSDCKLSEKANVHYNDNIIGKVVNKTYQSSLDKILAIFFVIDDGEYADYIYDNQCYFVAIPQIKCTKLICPVCGNVYNSGQNSCECIYMGSLLIINSFDIVGLKLFDTSKSMCFDNDKEIILRDFFGGAVGNIIITEEI
jgi:hypothetical protein